MANIDDLLEQIQSAIYGKEVRGAIHDAIQQCYEDTETYRRITSTIAPTFDTSTRYFTGDYAWYYGTLYRFNRNHAPGSWSWGEADPVVIGEDIGDLENIVWQYNRLNCRNLLNDYSIVSGTQYGVTCTYNLDGSVTFSGTNTHPSGGDLAFFYLEPSVIPSNLEKGGYYRCQMDSNVVAMIIVWHSALEPSPVQISVDEVTSESTIHVPEAANYCAIYLRISNGATVNETVHPHIFVPIGTEELSGEVEELKSTIAVNGEALLAGTDAVTGNGVYSFRYGGYYRTSDDQNNGAFVDSDEGNPYVCVKIPCQPGDVFMARVEAVGASTRAYGIYGSENQLIHRATVSSGRSFVNGQITIPEGDASYIVFNNKLNALPNGFYVVKGGVLLKDTVATLVTGLEAANTVIAACYKYGGLINNETDLDDLKNNGTVYRWTGGSRPINSPTNYAGAVYVTGGAQGFYQLVINSKGGVFARAFSSGTWTGWTHLANTDDVAALDGKMDAISETVDVELLDGVTGDAGATYTIDGINLTKVADNEFTLTGKSTASTAKAFNVLLGNNQTANSSVVLDSNISTPGTYKLVYETDQPTYDGVVFALTEGSSSNRQYLTNGDTFVVDSSPVCLFVYGSTSLNLTNTPLTVKWGLYHGEEYAGYPYTDDGTIETGVDYVARGVANEAMDAARVGPLSWGQANILASIKHVLNIRWTPVAQMPMAGELFYPLTEQKGLPYSSVRDTDKAIGTNVSFRTFMTAVRDPHSVLYTRKSNTDNADTYYGCVCSGLCNYAYRFGLHLTNTFMGSSDWFETIPMQSIEIGDLLYVPGHVAIVSGLTKDKYGRISTVDVSEEISDVAHGVANGRTVHNRSWSQFLSKRQNYIARRLKWRNGVEYTPIPYVQSFDETPQVITYPDVQTDHGDEAVFVVGEDVLVNVIDAKDYTSIVVTLDGDTVTTKSAIEAFTLANVQAGLYTITATGPENTSVSTFFVVDCTGSFDAQTGDVTFSSSNATPVLVDVYSMPLRDGKYEISCKPIPLTDEDRTRGGINVLSYMDNNYKNAKVTFNTPYGTAMWYSETHDRWVPIT